MRFFFADIKSAIARSIAERFSDADKKKITPKASTLDPRFKAMKFLSSSKRAYVYAQLLVAASGLSAATLAAPEDEPVPSCPSPKRFKMDNFLECGNARIAVEVGLCLRVVKELPLRKR